MMEDQHEKGREFAEVASKALSMRVVEARQWPCALLDHRYELSETELGRGTYGSVYKARRREEDTHYALKKMEHLEDKNELGFPITTLREIKLLQGLSHPHILNINEVVYERGTRHRPPVIYLCLDLMDCDLKDLISHGAPVSPSQVQLILRSVLKGLRYLHGLNIAHRDIKPSNVLLNEQGSVKLADFGLAKKLRKLSTVKVVTLWYRAPQLLLGIRAYSPKVDVWSVGCLAAQLLTRHPLFEQQQNESEITRRIFELVGTPDTCGWSAQAQQGSNWETLKPQASQPSSIVQFLRSSASEFEQYLQLLDLVEKMLRLNPHSRPSASECLEHDFFKVDYPDQPLLPPALLELKKTGSEGEETGRKRVKMDSKMM